MVKSLFLRAARDWTEDSNITMASPSLTAKTMYFYVQEIGHFHCLPAYYTERENLSSYLIVYTVKGKGYLHYKGTQHTLIRGQAFFIHCMDYQYYKTDSDELWEILWVHFDGSSSRHYYEQFLMGSSPPIVALAEQSPVPLLLHELMRLHNHPDARTELLSSQALVQILTDLLLHSYSRNQLTAIRFLPDYIEQAQLFLKEHLSEKISLNRLSIQFSLSKYHLAREFKAFTGLTPSASLINLRVNKAKELLRYSNISVQEIAKQVGFDNVSHFINMFKNQENTTPLSFRKTWQRPKSQ